MKTKTKKMGKRTVAGKVKVRKAGWVAEGEDASALTPGVSKSGGSLLRGGRYYENG